MTDTKKVKNKRPFATNCVLENQTIPQMFILKLRFEANKLKTLGFIFVLKQNTSNIFFLMFNSWDWYSFFNVPLYLFLQKRTPQVQQIWKSVYLVQTRLGHRP